MWFSIPISSLIFGFTISFFCVISGFLWRLGVYNLSSANVSVKQKRNLSRIAKVIEVTAILPSLTIHPVLISTFFFQVFSIGFLGRILPIRLDQHWSGIVLVAWVLYLPYAHFPILFLPLEDMIAHREQALRLGVRKLIATVFFVIGPILIRLIPILLVVTVLSQGLVFLPEISSADHKSFIGRELYKYIMQERLLASTAWILLASLAVTILAIWVINKFFKKTDALFGKFAIFFAHSLEEHHSSPCLVFSITKYFKKLLFPILLMPYAFVAILNLLLVLVFIGYSIEGLRDYGSIMEMLNSFKSSKSDISFMNAVRHTGTLAIFSASLATILALLLVHIGGKLDKQEPGRFSWFIYSVSLSVSMVPVAVFAYLLANFFGNYPWLGSIGGLSTLGLALGLLVLYDSFYLKLFRSEKIRRALALGGLNYWLSISPTIFKSSMFFLLWVFLLTWNDSIIQLFFPTLEGLPNKILPLGRDGINPVDRSILSVLQMFVMMIALPIWLIAYDKIKFKSQNPISI